jgi:pantoate--beta-alanine ligase
VSTVGAISELRTRLDAARAGGQRVGFVPTMGYLHDGHASLIRAARVDTDLVVVSIFVNPLQFGAGEDLDAYPRDLAGDIAAAEAEGVDVLFAPTVAEMYPEPTRTTVHVADLTDGLCGAARPTHFDGVTTVVAQLFAIVGSCAAYFGEKDFQQLAVVRRMATDLSLPVQVVGCPTVRDADGLALSSRNAYLEPEERRVAPLLHRALGFGADAVRAGERDPRAVIDVMTETIAAEPMFDLDYAAVVDAGTFSTPNPLAGELRLLAAARLGKARLIDNLGVTVNHGMHRKES